MPLRLPHPHIKADAKRIVDPNEVNENIREIVRACHSLGVENIKRADAGISTVVLERPRSSAMLMFDLATAYPGTPNPVELFRMPVAGYLKAIAICYATVGGESSGQFSGVLLDENDTELAVCKNLSDQRSFVSRDVKAPSLAPGAVLRLRVDSGHIIGLGLDLTFLHTD